MLEPTVLSEKMKDRLRIMPDWDQIFQEKGHVFTEPHPEMEGLVKLFHDASVKNILDVGCGTGRHLVYLAKHGFTMFGFDVSEHAIQMARKWLHEEGLSADLLQHGMESIFPYADNTFDAIISVQVIHHNRIREIRNAVAEIERVLSPRGYVFITVPILSQGPIDPEDDWHLNEIEPGTYIPQRGPESGVYHHYFTEEELLELFSSFRVIKLTIDEIGHRCLLGKRR